MNESDERSIECFAQLCAMLDDGSLPQAAILAAYSLDEPAFRQMHARFLPLLSSGTAPDLAIRFAGAYARARQRVPHEDGLAPPVCASEEDVDTDRDGMAGADGLGEPDRTLEMVVVGAPPALPFSARVCDLPTARQPPGRADEPADVTLEVAGAPPAAVLLPFSPAPPTGRRQRLQRFDTQTGRPLAAPIWVDEPTPVSPRR